MVPGHTLGSSTKVTRRRCAVGSTLTAVGGRSMAVSDGGRWTTAVVCGDSTAVSVSGSSTSVRGWSTGVTGDCVTCTSHCTHQHAPARVLLATLSVLGPNNQSTLHFCPYLCQMDFQNPFTDRLISKFAIVIIKHPTTP